MKKLILTRHILVEKNEPGEKVSCTETPHLAVIPPSCPTPSCPSSLDQPVLTNPPVDFCNPPAKKVTVKVKNINTSVNIDHITKWKAMIQKLRATLRKPEDGGDKTRQSTEDKTTDRAFRTLLKTIRENFSDTISTPQRKRKGRPKKKKNQTETENLSPVSRTSLPSVSRDQEDKNMDICQEELQKPLTGKDIFTPEELALLDSDPDDETMETGQRIEQDADKLLESEDNSTPSPPTFPESPDYGPQEISEDEEYAENRHGRLQI
jgi:hypothetical protein